MPYVSYIEFNVPDTKQAAEFYKKVFGWDALVQCGVSKLRPNDHHAWIG